MNHRTLFRSLFVLLLCLRPLDVFAAGAPKKIVLIAGPITGHPKEAHEYEKNIILLRHLLETSPDLRGAVRVETHFNGWPDDPATLEDADTIFLTSDGTDRDEKNHPLYTGDHLQVIERQMKRGCGLIFFHWSTFNPARAQDKIIEWVGGYFDYETGSSPNRWYSAIQTWNADSKPASPDHPILRGVKPFTTREEYYYRLRFREPDAHLAPIIATRPPKETNDFTVGWAVERADGGRGFGFTGGHFYANWWNADFRKLILNAIVWTAHLTVPPEGVRSEPFDRFKALILTGHNHPAHDWRATTAALILALEQDPRALVHVRESLEDLGPPGANAAPAPVGAISDYDLVVLNYCNWEQPGLSATAKTNFLRYLNNGGGLAIIHFSNGAWHPSLPNTRPEDAWPEFHTRICRRVWEHRPPNASAHDPFGPFQVEIARVAHPIIEGLQPFATVDELYFHQQGDGPIEPLAYALSKTTGYREPMAWAYDYEKARVFQTVLGHAAESVRKAAALIRRGCVWAARRDALTFDPPSDLTEGALFREGSPWTPEESLKKAGRQASLEHDSSAGTPAGGVSADVTGAHRTVDSVRTALKVGTAVPLQVAGAVNPAPAAEAVSPVRAGSRPAGTPAIAGHAPESQNEQDWIDNRWSRTDVGPFLASSLRVPNGTIAKALSIRVGERDEASVCFDTANLNLRAGWIGGFLEFDAARFGLLNLPKIAGDVQFVAPEGPGWIGATGRFGGFHVQGKRVVLEYKVGETAVRESPWYAQTNGWRIFVRAFEVGPGAERLSVNLLEPVNRRMSSRDADDGAPGEISNDGTKAVVNGGRMALSLSVVRGKATFEKLGRRIVLNIPARTAVEQISVATRVGPANPTQALPAEVRDFGSTAAEGLDTLSRAHRARWLPVLETTGHVAADTGLLSIDTLTVPYDNPWNALMFLSGVDFTSDGTGYVCSIHGDVWKVTGIDDKLGRLRWQRFATGLYQPLGLKVVGDQVYVLGRDQITRLRDTDGDGEADFYENFCGLIQTIAEPHHYVSSLETDASGHFYYVDPLGAHRVSPDGRTMETLATGFRNPNGMGASPDGRIVTIAPQQGEWTPSSLIIEAKRGGYYGYGGPKVTPDRPLGYDPVLCWIPHSVDNSGGSQVWVPPRAQSVPRIPPAQTDLHAQADWGLFAGQMLHFSWGRCAMMLVLRDESDGVPQAATVELPGRFLSGAMRGAFNPRDGHLYVVGSTGWQTSALKDGCFQRVRYTGKPIDVPIAWHVRREGLTLTFAQALDRQTAEDPGSYGLEQWNYRYAAQYGSKDWSVANPGREGHDPVEVRSAMLSPDGRTVQLEIAGLKPVMQLQVQYNLDSKEGATLRGKVYATINRVP